MGFLHWKDAYGKNRKKIGPLFENLTNSEDF